MYFDWGLLTRADRELASRYIGGERPEDYCFFPPNNVYQFRWFLAPIQPTTQPSATLPQVYLHIMTGDDPTGELHDHDWHNTTHVLAGAALEEYSKHPEMLMVRENTTHVRILRPGNIIHRDAKEAHRLMLTKDAPYLMTLFAIGPKIRSNMRWKL